MNTSLSCRLIEESSDESCAMNASLDNKVRSEKKWNHSDALRATILRQTIGLLFITFLVASQHSECAKNIDNGRVVPGEPCICNSTFFKSCPKEPKCKEDVYDPDLDKGNFDPFKKSSFGAKRFLAGDDYHDIDDPDHVDMDSPLDAGPRDLAPSLMDVNWPVDQGSNPMMRSSNEDPMTMNDDPMTESLDEEPMPRSGDEPLPLADSDAGVSGDEVMVERHRKVYVAEDKEPKIHPIRLTIPVKLRDTPTIPTPKPIYKLKKYTTYETQPEIKLVPVTKTIIKPAGVSSDQIIE